MPSFRPRPPVAEPLRRLAEDRRGGVLIVVALAILPLAGSIGLGTEYLRKGYYQAHLDSAADAAAMAAITTAREHISTNPNKSADPTAEAKALAESRAAAVFRSNAAATLGHVPTTPQIDLVRTGQTLTATVSYATTFSSPFGAILGGSGIGMSGRSVSSLTIGSYVDFYLLLDTSGSMGFPTSKEQQISFAKLNPDMRGNQSNNCAFACHFPGFQGYTLSKQHTIELRIKTVGKAVTGLLDTAKQSTTLGNQFRVGLYPFVSDIEVAAGITADLDGLKTYANNLENYMDVGNSDLARGSGGTHYDKVLSGIGGRIPATAGDGSTAAKARPVIFMITDGVANSQNWYGKNGSGRWTGSKAALLDPKLCQPLKDRNVTISVLYVPYEPIQPPFNGDAVVKAENTLVNTLIPKVPEELRKCASPGYFFTASSATEITAALKEMFKQTIAVARLTQ